jgi:hypothetical protein
MMAMDIVKARVFVSCGQRDKEEKRIAALMEEKLVSLGFEPYVAIHKQSTGSLMKNILKALKDCEYYLFIDFKREQIIPEANKDKSMPTNYRGSLFSNQELAIAAYLEKPIMAFQERGVKIRDGMLGAIQANVIPFDNRKNLVNRVLEKAKTNWTSNWRNEIIFHDRTRNKISPEQVSQYGQTMLPARFFHISVKNLHKDRSARNCVTYLESYKVFSNETSEPQDEVIPQPVELKWNGMRTQSVLIPPNMIRKIDAVFFYENNPHVVHVGVNPFLVDSSSHFKQLEGVKTFHLNFVVYSDNFFPIRSSYVLKVGQTINQTRFYRKE